MVLCYSLKNHFNIQRNFVLATPTAAVHDNIRERKTASEGYRNLTATWPFRHLPKGCHTMKALPALGRLSTVSNGWLRPFQLDFSQIVAKINLFRMTKTVDRALLY